MQINKIRIRMNNGDAETEYIDGDGGYIYQSVNLQDLATLINQLETIGASSGGGLLNPLFDSTNNEITIQKNGSAVGNALMFDLDGAPLQAANQLIVTNSTQYKITTATSVIMQAGQDVLAQVTITLPKRAHGTLLTDYSITPVGGAVITTINSASFGANWRAILTTITMNSANSIIHILSL